MNVVCRLKRAMLVSKLRTIFFFSPSPSSSLLHSKSKPQQIAWAFDVCSIASPTRLSQERPYSKPR